MKQLERRGQALRRLDELFRSQGQVLLIHYSCESFYDRPNGTSPRITSIAVRSLGYGQTTSFSIHQVAERESIQPGAIPQEYDRLERTMLDEFASFIESHSGYIWVHWNMRDANYGFEAIEHRHRVLKGTPSRVPVERRMDLASLLIELYGPGYAAHPRLTDLTRLNNISALGFSSGKEEAEAFEKGEYVRLHQSTLRKVDVFANILHRVGDGSLRTRARWYEPYGLSLRGLVEAVTDHWLYKLLGFIGILVTLLGFYVGLRTSSGK